MVHADGLALLDARASAATVLANSGSNTYQGLASEGLKLLNPESDTISVAFFIF